MEIQYLILSCFIVGALAVGIISANNLWHGVDNLESMVQDAAVARMINVARKTAIFVGINGVIPLLTAVPFFVVHWVRKNTPPEKVKLGRPKKKEI